MCTQAQLWVYGIPTVFGAVVISKISGLSDVVIYRSGPEKVEGSPPPPHADKQDNLDHQKREFHTLLHNRPFINRPFHQKQHPIFSTSRPNYNYQQFNAKRSSQIVKGLRRLGRLL